MGKKLSPEEFVVDFFDNADITKVETVFNIVRSKVKKRLTGVGLARPSTKVGKPKAIPAKPTEDQLAGVNRQTVNLESVQ